MENILDVGPFCRYLRRIGLITGVFLMVQIRENWQKQLTARIADTGLLRTGLALGTVRMLVCIIIMPGVKESAP